MKPKMSKRYINYEESGFEKKQQAEPPREGEHNNLEPIWKIILSTVIGGIVRLLFIALLLVVYDIIFPTVFKYTYNIGYVLLTVALFSFISGCFLWVQNRITTWRIDYYIRREMFSKIWDTPVLANYVLKYKGQDFYVNNNQLRHNRLPLWKIDGKGLHIDGEHFNKNTKIEWMVDESLYREVVDLTKKFIKGFSILCEGDGFYYLSNTIKYWLWELLYFLILLISVYYEFKISHDPESSTALVVISWTYLIAHIAYTLPRLVIRWTFVLSGFTSIDANFNSLVGARWTWFGRPIKILINDSAAYTWKVYLLSEQDRFFINLIRHFTIF